MGKMTTTSPELAQTVLAGTFAATAATPPTNVALLGNFNVAVWGTFVGTAQVVTSFDGGTTWIPVVNKRTGLNITFTAPGAIQEDEVEPGVLYGLVCTAFTSGTINWRISEGAAGGSPARLS